MKKRIKKYIHFQREIQQLKRALKHESKPRLEFFATARENFLAEFEKKDFSFAEKENKQHLNRRKHSWRFALSGIFLAFLAGGGVMALAYQPSVGPSHPLYSVKRAGENIQLALSSKNQEPFVHYQLAKNRLAEIKILNDNTQNQNSNDQNNLSKQSIDPDAANKKQAELEKLNQEFNVQIDAALRKIDQIDDKVNDRYSNLTSSTKKKQKDHCESIAAALKERNSVLSNFDIDYKEDFMTWQNNCGQIMDVSPGSVSS